MSSAAARAAPGGGLALWPQAPRAPVHDISYGSTGRSGQFSWPGWSGRDTCTGNRGAGRHRFTRNNRLCAFIDTALAGVDAIEQGGQEGLGADVMPAAEVAGMTCDTKARQAETSKASGRRGAQERAAELAQLIRNALAEFDAFADESERELLAGSVPEDEFVTVSDVAPAQGQPV